MSDPRRARQLHKALEPIHAMVYFCPQARAEYEAIGVTDGGQAYFGSRSAPLGVVDAEVVAATFYNFWPGAVREAIPAVWQMVTPARILAARYTGAGQALRGAFDPAGITDADVAEAASLARRAASKATEDIQGRPLFAAHAGLDWPDERVEVLWHAATLLREHRGDGHIAALLTEGIGPIRALILHLATGDFPGKFLRITRRWPDELWDAEVETMLGEGLIALTSAAAGPDSAGDERDRDRSLVLTEAGRSLRSRVEDVTDRLAAPVFDALDEAGADRLGVLASRCSAAVVDAGLLGGRRR